ncbi:MAG: hypothetical protein GF353_25885 [Candidatus Lokiarchaeota archaeon]|nr:hypothetical protein [Candidatus Lokiarchaeota archaeon]
MKKKVDKYIVKKKYLKIRDFKQYYVTGAIGGFRNPYDFRLTFYNVDTNDLLIKTQNMKNKSETDEENLEKEISNIRIPHLLQCELIMTERTVREIYKFLGRELKMLEKSKEFKTYAVCKNCGHKFLSPIQIRNIENSIIQKNLTICPNCGEETEIEKNVLINE